MRYRRAWKASGTFFFTVNLADRRSNLLVRYIAELRAAFHMARKAHPFAIDAIVVLPDHLHAIWSLPSGDADFSTRWTLIKGVFSRSVPRGERVSTSRIARGERGIWQGRFWEHRVRDEADMPRVDYVRWNRVKHGYAEGVGDRSYSSFAPARAEGSVACQLRLGSNAYRKQFR